MITTWVTTPVENTNPTAGIVTPMAEGRRLELRLTHVLEVKVAVTLLLWAGPLLLAPPALFTSLGLTPPDPPYVAHLLGAAYLALCVGYVGGWIEARRGRYPRGAVQMGVVSNGLACLLLIGHGVAGSWAGWAGPAQVYLWGSALLAGAITVGLLVGRVPPSDAHTDRVAS